MSKVYRLEQSQFIPKSREEVFTFFADASNLERITPAFLHFHIRHPVMYAIWITGLQYSGRLSNTA